MRNLLLISVAISLTIGTSACTKDQTVKIDPLTPQQLALQEGRELRLSVSKQQFKDALRTVDPFKIRVVPILKAPATIAITPEYRLFEISPGSAYSIIGLQNTDILLAAEDYPIVEPEKFPVYMKFLQGQDKAKLLIKRGDEPLVLLINFTE